MNPLLQKVTVVEPGDKISKHVDIDISGNVISPSYGNDGRDSTVGPLWEFESPHLCPYLEGFIPRLEAFSRVLASSVYLSSEPSKWDLYVLGSRLVSLYRLYGWRHISLDRNFMAKSWLMSLK